MSFWDNVKKLTQPYADDDYDDYDEDEESVDEYDQPEERPARRASHRASSAPAPAPARVTAEEPAEDDDFGFNPTLTTPSSPSASTGGFSGQVLNMGSSVSATNKQEVVLFRPNNFNDLQGCR